MAQEVLVTLTDDLDGSDAEETILFALDGASYEIDLNKKNAAALRKAVDKYVAAARSANRFPGARQESDLGARSTCRTRALAGRSSARHGSIAGCR